MDLSHFDKKYFLDDRRYNCPFCNRGSVTYEVVDKASFSWSDNRVVYIYLIRCEERDCQKTSMHLSDFDFQASGYSHYFQFGPQNLKKGTGQKYDSKELDSYFFLHQPTSFFTIDPRINGEIRELISEAENSLRMNFLVGASACLRKAIYELIDLEKVQVMRSAQAIDYGESIKKLKEKFNRVPGEYFDALAGIQELASDKVHEGSWEAWDGSKLRILIELTKNVLHEMYVIPEEQKGRAGIVSKLLGDFKGSKKAEND